MSILWREVRQQEALWRRDNEHARFLFATKNVLQVAFLQTRVVTEGRFSLQSDLELSRQHEETLHLRLVLRLQRDDIGRRPVCTGVKSWSGPEREDGAVKCQLTQHSGRGDRIATP